MAAFESLGVNGNLLRQSLRLGLSVLISIPLLRRLGLSRGLSTAAVITIMVLGMPGNSNAKGNAAQSVGGSSLEPIGKSDPSGVQPRRRTSWPKHGPQGGERL
jgi:hypothetical protein